MEVAALDLGLDEVGADGFAAKPLSQSSSSAGGDCVLFVEDGALEKEPNPRSSNGSCDGAVGFDDGAKELPPSASRPAQALEACALGADDLACVARACLSCSARAARCAMVRFTPFEDGPEDSEPESRPLNASPLPGLPVLAPVLFAFWKGCEGVLPPREAGWDGAGVRALTDEDEPAAASMEKTSFCGLRWAADMGDPVAIAPSFRGCSAGLDAPVELQRSANASDMVGVATG